MITYQAITSGVSIISTIELKKAMSQWLAFFSEIKLN